MLSLPDEILFTIITKYNYELIFVNKHFNSLYDEYYYKYILENSYLNKQLFIQTNYKNLFINYLREGVLYQQIGSILDGELISPICINIKGVKASTLCFNKNFYHITN